MSAPAGALWDAPAGNAREGEEGVGESPHVVGVVKSGTNNKKRRKNINNALIAMQLQVVWLFSWSLP